MANEMEVCDESSLSNQSSYYEYGCVPFIPPPEAPTFEPTEVEFKDPLKYINKIRPIAEKCGICKIKPPADWQPPFSINVDLFKFTPRIQRLNELEAKTRIKLNFLDQIAKFWELQGSQLKIPLVEQRALDLYTLYKLVEEEGGMEVVSEEKKWSKIAGRMNYYPPGKKIASVLKFQYYRILFPYYLFQQGKSVPNNIKQSKLDEESETEDKDMKHINYFVKKDNSVHDMKRPRRSSTGSLKSFNGSEDLKINELNKDSEENKELKRLQFFGAGPKMAGFEKAKKEQEEKQKNKTRGKKAMYDFDPLAKYVCHNCDRGDDEETMLLCDGCDDSYHMKCLVPPLDEIPKGDWRCPKCVAKEVSKPAEAFGFEQAQREYSLHEFGEMADNFKYDYFRMPPHQVPTSVVEKEFWRIVSLIDEDVTVEYGADLHTMDHGSGFPTNQMFLEGNEYDCLKKYANCGWNLNNLPILKGSVLGYINADISGMKVPWMYVGMCFSTFCWHNEDHWSYSINYLHWGEPKTWYGVPGSSAVKFESSMKEAAPELFDSQPDLLHQLVTIMNPNVLMDAGVPIYRTDQHAGEFVITFPRAYHAGFNQGYNFAEAVNFAPPDWLTKGRECVAHYSNLHRFCVFSHDELICKMACNPDELETRIAKAAYEDFIIMIENENNMRKSLQEWGVFAAKREEFESLPDDERQCEVCKTTCFLSALTCPCSDKLVCLRHFSELCKCLPQRHILRYRYQLDELHNMLNRLKARAESFDQWVKQIETVLDSQKPKTIDLDDLKELLREAKEKNLPHPELVDTLSKAVDFAEKCSEISQRIIINIEKMKASEIVKASKLTADELSILCTEIDKLLCTIKEGESMKELLKNVNEFKKQAGELIDKDIVESGSIKKCIDFGSSIWIELEELPLLKEKFEKMKWLEGIKTLQENPDKVTAEFLKSLLKSEVKSAKLTNLNIKIPDVEKLLHAINNWEDKAKACISGKTLLKVTELNKLLVEGEQIPAFLPSKEPLKKIMKKAKEWCANLFNYKALSLDPYLEDLEELISVARNIPVDFEIIDNLQSQVDDAKEWKEKSAQVFLKKNSPLTLMEALSPRSEVGIHTYRVKKRTLRDNNSPNFTPTTSVAGVKLTGVVSPDDVSAAFVKATEKEAESMCHLRVANINKRTSVEGGTTFCLCRSPVSGSMTECVLCKELYHNMCIPGLRKVKNDSHFKFVCPVCMRTRRPNIDTVLQLLIALQKIRVRLPEGEALQSIATRAAKWLNLARKFLSMPQIANVLELLGKPKSDISKDLTDNEDNSNASEDISNKDNIPENSEMDLSESTNTEDSLPTTSSDSLPTKIKSNSNLGITFCVYNSNVKVTFSKKMKYTLRELILEGHLLEVTFSEMDKIWILMKSSASKRKLEEYPIMLAKKKKKDAEFHEENEESCALAKCLHPAKGGDIVDWVQCDKCNQWFHMTCVNLKTSDINEDEEYVCKNCLNILARDSEFEIIERPPQGTDLIVAFADQSLNENLSENAIPEYDSIIKEEITD